MSIVTIKNAAFYASEYGDCIIVNCHDRAICQQTDCPRMSEFKKYLIKFENLTFVQNLLRNGKRKEISTFRY